MRHPIRYRTAAFLEHHVKTGRVIAEPIADARYPNVSLLVLEINGVPRSRNVRYFKLDVKLSVNHQPLELSIYII